MSAATRSCSAGLALAAFRLNGQFLEVAEELARPAGLTAAWWQVLGAVLREPLPVAGIARTMGITRQSVQRIADLLVDQGLAEYRPTPPHRRAKLLAPTDAGRAAVERIDPGHAALAARLADEVGRERLAAALRSSCTDSRPPSTPSGATTSGREATARRMHDHVRVRRSRDRCRGGDRGGRRHPRRRRRRRRPPRAGRPAGRGRHPTGEHGGRPRRGHRVLQRLRRGHRDRRGHPSCSNWFLDTARYKDSWYNPLAPTFTVDLRPACDLHDAGYEGGIVVDRINGGAGRLHRLVPAAGGRQVPGRPAALCTAQIPLRTYGWWEPGTTGVARQKCQGSGTFNLAGLYYKGARDYHAAVRALGRPFFDADPATQGLQAVGPRPND